MSSVNPFRQTFAAAWGTTFLINIAWGVIFPLRNIYIHDQGISLLQIGTLATAGAITFSLSGLAIGRLSDRLGRRRPLIILLLLLAGSTTLGYLLATEYWHFLVLAVVEMGLLGGYIVLIDTTVSSILPEQSRGGGFGRYRISGSLGFALAAVQLGTITGTFGIRSIFVIASAALLSAALAAALMQGDHITEPQPADPLEVPESAPTTKGLLRVLLATGLIWFLAADLVSMLGSQIAYPFLNIYVHETLGATSGQIGYYTTLGVLAEIPAMLLLGRLSDRLGRGPVLAFGFFTSALTWLLIFRASSLAPVYLAGILNGMGIIRYSVGVALITDRAPPRGRAGLIGLSNLNFGIGGIAGPVLGGAIVERSNARQVFLVAFAVNMAALAAYSLQVVRERRTAQLAQGLSGE